MKTSIALALLSTLVSVSVAQAKTVAPYYPSVSIKVIAGDMGIDGCVARINPPSTTEFKFTYVGGNEEKSLAGYLEQYRGYSGEYVSDTAVKEMSIPFVLQAADGSKTLQTTRIQASVSPVLQGDTDASGLTLGTLWPVMDEVDELLLGLPSVAVAAINGSVMRWNQVVNDAKASRQVQATLKVSEVTEWKIQAAMEVIADAQAILLVKYACDGQDVNKYSAAINAYLNRLTDAVTTLNTR